MMFSWTSHRLVVEPATRQVSVLRPDLSMGSRERTARGERAVVRVKPLRLTDLYIDLFRFGLLGFRKMQV